LAWRPRDEVHVGVAVHAHPARHAPPEVCHARAAGEGLVRQSVHRAAAVIQVDPPRLRGRAGAVEGRADGDVGEPVPVGVTGCGEREPELFPSARPFYRQVGCAIEPWPAEIQEHLACIHVSAGVGEGYSHSEVVHTIAVDVANACDRPPEQVGHPGAVDDYGLRHRDASFGEVYSDRAGVLQPASGRVRRPHDKVRDAVVVQIHERDGPPEVLHRLVPVHMSCGRGILGPARSDDWQARRSESGHHASNDHERHRPPSSR